MSRVLESKCTLLPQVKEITWRKHTERRELQSTHIQLLKNWIRNKDRDRKRASKYQICPFQCLLPSQFIWKIDFCQCESCHLISTIADCAHRERIPMIAHSHHYRIHDKFDVNTHHTDEKVGLLPGLCEENQTTTTLWLSADLMWS